MEPVCAGIAADADDVFGTSGRGAGIAADANDADNADWHDSGRVDASGDDAVHRMVRRDGAGGAGMRVLAHVPVSGDEVDGRKQKTLLPALLGPARLYPNACGDPRGALQSLQYLHGDGEPQLRGDLSVTTAARSRSRSSSSRLAGALQYNMM